MWSVLDGGWDRIDHGRRSGRPAQALLRGHDPCPADPGACAVSRGRASPRAAPTLRSPASSVNPHLPRTLAQRHPFRQAIADSPSVLERPAGSLAAGSSGARPSAFPPGTGGRVWMKSTWASQGVTVRTHKVHRDIAALAPGDPLEGRGWTRTNGGSCWSQLGNGGGASGTRNFEPPAGMRCVTRRRPCRRDLETATHPSPSSGTD